MSIGMFHFMPSAWELIIIGVIAFVVYKIVNKGLTNNEKSISTVLTVKNIFSNSFTIAKNNIAVIFG